MGAARNTVLVSMVAVGLMGAGKAEAVTVNLPMSVVGQAISADGSHFFINYPVDPVYTDYTPSSPSRKERRGVMEFSLAGVPAGAVVESVELNFVVASYNSQSNGDVTLYPFVRFFGYAGNNAIDVSDATRNEDNLELGNETINDLGAWSVELDADKVQMLLNADAAAIGILSYAESLNLPVGFWTENFGGGIVPPTISLTYSAAAGLDGDFNGDGAINAADLTILNNGFGQHLSGYANGDFNRDGVIDYDDFALFDRALANYSASAPLLGSVPEPACGVVAGLGWVMLGRRRRVVR